MATLYDLSVPTFLQTVSAVGGFLDRTTRHCAATGADLEEIVKTRLVPDMPLWPQLQRRYHNGRDTDDMGISAVCRQCKPAPVFRRELL